MREQVAPKLWGNGLWNHFTGRKRYTIQCGKCQHTWREKVLLASDEASALCPSCGAQNVWRHSEFEAAWNRRAEAARTGQ
jgi:predicted RNA-binding Zn-ribbon protein involved in translation (DUF1610 family)